MPVPAAELKDFTLKAHLDAGTSIGSRVHFALHRHERTALRCSYRLAHLVAAMPRKTKQASGTDPVSTIVTCDLTVTQETAKVQEKKPTDATDSPGFKPSNFSKTKLVSGESLEKHISQWRVDTTSFTQSIEVHHNEQFTLKPVSAPGRLPFVPS